MRCPGGDYLTNDNVIDIFHACFRIGHYQTERSKDMSGALSDNDAPLQRSLLCAGAGYVCCSLFMVLKLGSCTLQCHSAVANLRRMS